MGRGGDPRRAPGTDGAQTDVVASERRPPRESPRARSPSCGRPRQALCCAPRCWGEGRGGARGGRWPGAASGGIPSPSRNLVLITRYVRLQTFLG